MKCKCDHEIGYHGETGCEIAEMLGVPEYGCRCRIGFDALTELQAVHDQHPPFELVGGECSGFRFCAVCSEGRTNLAWPCEPLRAAMQAVGDLA